MVKRCLPSPLDDGRWVDSQATSRAEECRSRLAACPRPLQPCREFCFDRVARTRGGHRHLEVEADLRSEGRRCRSKPRPRRSEHLIPYKQSTVFTVNCSRYAGPHPLPRAHRARSDASKANLGRKSVTYFRSSRAAWACRSTAALIVSSVYCRTSRLSRSERRPPGARRCGADARWRRSSASRRSHGPGIDDDGPGIYRARRNSAPERAEAQPYLTLKVPFMPSAAWPDTVHSYL